MRSAYISPNLQLGEQLLAGVQKVLTAVKVPVSLVKTDAKAVAGTASHILAGVNSARLGPFLRSIALQR